MVDVVSISLFKCASFHAYLVFYAICVACSDCGLVNYVLSHAFLLEPMTSHCGLLLQIMRLLCLEIIDLRLFMQLYY